MIFDLSWATWGPPIVVGLIALAAGVALALRSRRGGAASRGPTREDLLARKEALVEQLRGLEAERSKLGAEAYAERWQYTLDRAARALQAIDRFDTAPPQAETAAEVAAASAGSTWNRVGWALATVVFFGILGMTMTKAVKPRGEGGMTGATVDAQQAALDAAKARLDKDPSDIDDAALLAHASIRDGDLEAGMKYVDLGRKAAPDDLRIQSSLAALMIAIGYVDKAVVVLDQVQQADPKQPQAWLWRGYLASVQGDKPGAEAALSKVLELSEDAEDRRIAAAILADVRAPPPQVRMKGTVKLAPGTTVPDGALLLVYARASQVAAGPPLAALKLPASELPLDFTITDKDRPMVNGPWPDQVWIQARLDIDGNAMTKDEGAPASEMSGPITSPDAPVELVLQ